MPGPEDSLAASSPSNSLDLGTATGPQLTQQGPAGGFTHPLTGQQGKTGAFADPSDVEVALQDQHAPWEQEDNDILSYVQSKVRSTTPACLHNTAVCNAVANFICNSSVSCILGSLFSTSDR